jgi:hypothetical protein
MEAYEEKRSYQRYEHRSPMNLHRMDDQGQYYHAKMNDYSQSGLSMITYEKLVIGHLVYLEMQNYNKHATTPEKNKGYSGIVRWAKPYPSTNSVYIYGIEYSGSASYHC